MRKGRIMQERLPQGAVPQRKDVWVWECQAEVFLGKAALMSLNEGHERRPGCWPSSLPCPGAWALQGWRGSARRRTARCSPSFRCFSTIAPRPIAPRRWAHNRERWRLTDQQGLHRVFGAGPRGRVAAWSGATSSEHGVSLSLREGCFSVQGVMQLARASLSQGHCAPLGLSSSPLLPANLHSLEIREAAHGRAALRDE